MEKNINKMKSKNYPKAYKIKDCFFEEIVSKYNEISHVCTLQEFIEYNYGISTASFSDYFDKNNLPYDVNFKPDQVKGIDVILSTLAAIAANHLVKDS
jgi:hypothetical protein